MTEIRWRRSIHVDNIHQEVEGCANHSCVPVAVIDPENDAEIKQLASCLEDARGGWTGSSAHVAILRIALRKFMIFSRVYPEPDGLQWRVIDSEGDEWAKRKKDGRWAMIGSGSLPLDWNTLVTSYGPVEVVK
jgi:hypothetical protein